MMQRHCDNCNTTEALIQFPAPDEKYYGYYGKLEGDLDHTPLKVKIDVVQRLEENVDLCKGCFIKLLRSMVDELESPSIEEDMKA